MTEITGGTPYRASTIAGHRGDRQVSANELAMTRGSTWNPDRREVGS